MGVTSSKPAAATPDPPLAPAATPTIAPATIDGGSTSIVSAETSTGWHVSRVEEYSKIKAISGVGKYINCGKFMVGRHRWVIQFYPNGFTDRYSDCVSFGLCLDGHTEGTAVIVRFKFRLVDKHGEPVLPNTTSTGRLYTFTREVPGWVYAATYKRKDFESCYVEDDAFLIRCDVIVVEHVSEDSLLPPPDLHRHLGGLLLDGGGVGGDVTFEVGEEEFVAHKYVLAARSPVFKAEFFGAGGAAMEERTAAARVRIRDVEPVVFKAMLHFIYTDSLPEEMDDGDDKLVVAQHLLVAADRYDIPRLKLICANTLCTFMDASVAVPTLVLAEQHGCHRLKRACLKFLRTRGNFFKAVEIDGNIDLLRSYPSLMHDITAC